MARHATCCGRAIFRYIGVKEAFYDQKITSAFNYPRNLFNADGLFQE